MLDEGNFRKSTWQTEGGDVDSGLIELRDSRGRLILTATVRPDERDPRGLYVNNIQSLAKKIPSDKLGALFGQFLDQMNRGQMDTLYGHVTNPVLERIYKSAGAKKD